MDTIVPRRNTSSFNLGIGSFLNPAMRRAYNRYRGRFQRATGKRRAGGRAQSYQQYKRKKTTSSAGILGGTNADTRLIYRKKRMPAKKRRRWASFIKKVNAVDERTLGTRTVLINDQLNQTGTGGQNTMTLALYGFVNTFAPWLNDMNQIGQNENEGNPTAVAGATIAANTKVMFQSAVMDITLRNVSTFREAGIDKISPDAALELDIYDVYIRSDPSTPDADTNNWSTISAYLNRYDDPEIGGTGTGFAISDRGASPFEFGSQMARGGIKIMKKTKFFIPNGQTITWQCRDPKRHVCRYGDLETNDGWTKKGWTRVYYLVYKLVPGLTVGTTDGTYKASVAVGCTRKYAYKVEGFNEPRERLLGGTYTLSSNV